MKTTKILYTANFGGYDKTVYNKPPKDWVYSAIELPPYYDLSAAKSARKTKIIPYFWDNFDVSVWYDANMSINLDLDEIVDTYLKDADMAFVEHGRDCIYEEADACIERGKDDPTTIRVQMQKYRHEGYPIHNGLIATGFMIRRHNKKVWDVMQKWWAEVSVYSKRDQLSFNYAVWKTGNKVKINEIPYDVYREGKLVLNRHL